LKDPGLSRKIIILKKDLQEIGWGDVDRIRVVQGRVKCWAVVSTTMKLLFGRIESLIGQPSKY
jgi:hypothetical protein